MMRRRLCGFVRDDRGVAAIEMALLVGLVTEALLNVAEVGRYVYSSAGVVAATQSGAQAAAAACPLNFTPATVNCTGLNSAVNTAIHSGSLGERVSLTGVISEAWYCVNAATGALQNVGPVASPPSDCSSAGDASTHPALYLRVQTQYTYAPMFPGLTVVDALAQTIVRTAWMRMN